MPANPRVRSNNQFGLTSDNPLTAGALSLNSAELADFPAIATQHAVITLDPLKQFGDPEIVVITAHTALSTTATITRAAYGTTAREHPQSTTWVHAPIGQDVTTIATSGTLPGDPYIGQMVFETDTDKFVARNAANGAWKDAIPLGAWQSFAPTITQSGTVTHTVSRAAFTRIGNIIHAAVSLTVTGTGTANNQITVSIPVAPVANTVSIGVGYIYDGSANLIYMAIPEQTGTAVRWRGTTSTANTFLGAAGSPFTAALASGDLINYNLTYEAA